MIEIKGFDDLSKKLEDLAEKAESIHGTQEVPLSELLTPGLDFWRSTRGSSRKMKCSKRAASR
jgi:hypothetical protein